MVLYLFGRKSEKRRFSEGFAKLQRGESLFSHGKLLLTVFICLLVVSGGIAGCSISPSKSPRQVVIEFFGAMQSNEKPVLANVLDIEALMRTRQLDYSLNLEVARVFTSPDQIFRDLIDSGLTKQTWFKYQRVVGDEEIDGDTAYVAVTFIDRDTGKQTFNKFGVRKIGQRWRIFSFRTLVAPQ